MKILFMGTPLFSLPTLRALIEKGYVSAVFTQRPKPKNRSLNLESSPVHLLAQDHDIAVYTPRTLRCSESIELIKSIEADVIVVVSYGMILPKEVLWAKRYGAINLHPSDLPAFRGAAPLQHTILSRVQKTAVCIMQMDEGVDTGDILLKEEVELDEAIDFWSLHDLTSNIGARLMVQVLDNIRTITPLKQSSHGVSYANKLTKDDGRINWNDSAENIDAKVRAIAHWPGVHCFYQQLLLKFFKTKVVSDVENKWLYAQNGQIIHLNPMLVKCAEGLLEIIELQPVNKQRMSSRDFSNGYRLIVGQFLV
ncbi:Methionyl-tRNA formyltransferase [Rickettsiales endosymbiont of Paramecium tredecaurelia]|uniref:methionyl-tRNA formyltransferase n=1 Tax=Candidatus Sarmatiella mevalonica TaxID=2770581 RepID=UPI0019247E18|nr:methionyl-tRNA formyltransferase [Candidatus Sarmatiella mevalonica]MBL3284534.1 Methionyl-tRNA formyltransferase [Candidatus Sarmatiella mevalonica]